MYQIRRKGEYNKTILGGEFDPPRELRKRLKFDQTTKWYKRKPEPLRYNIMHKILWDSEMQRNHLIPARRLDLMITTNIYIYSIYIYIYIYICIYIVV